MSFKIWWITQVKGHTLKLAHRMHPRNVGSLMRWVFPNFLEKTIIMSYSKGSTSLKQADPTVSLYSSLIYEQHHAFHFTMYFHVSIICVSVFFLHPRMSFHPRLSKLLSIIPSPFQIALILIISFSCSNKVQTLTVAYKDLHSPLPAGLFSFIFWDSSPHSYPKSYWSPFLYYTCLAHSCQNFVWLAPQSFQVKDSPLYY